MSVEEEAVRRAEVESQNAEVLQAEQALIELTARVFKGADPGDLEDWLIKFAEHCTAFSRHEHENQFLANVCAGRRQAFFWLADHLKLDLPSCYPRYLRQTRGD